MKKRYFILAALMLALLAFTACSGEKTPDAAARPDASAAVNLSSGTDVSGTDVSASDADWYTSLDAEGRAIADVILSGSDAFNAKDKAAYLATIDREGEAYAETHRYVNYIFKHYTLTSTIDALEVVGVSGDSATVRVTQTTVKSGECEEGRTFADAQTVLLHTMTRRGGEWYITSTVVESRRELTCGWDALVDFVNSPVSGSDKSSEITTETTENAE